MNWKKWPYWIRGSFIGLVASIVFCILLINDPRLSAQAPILLLGFLLIGALCGWVVGIIKNDRNYVGPPAGAGRVNKRAWMIAYLFEKIKNKHKKEGDSSDENGEQVNS